MRNNFLTAAMSAELQSIEANDALIEELREIVGDENVLSEPDELLVYECDGLQSCAI